MQRRIDNAAVTANGETLSPGDPTRLAPVIAAIAAVATPLAGALYGVVRVGYENYYRELGLSPEMVGLGEAAIVSRVAVFVGLFILLLAAFGAFGVTIFRLASPLIERSAQSGTWVRQAGWFLSPFLVLIIAVVVSV